MEVVEKSSVYALFDLRSSRDPWWDRMANTRTHLAFGRSKDKGRRVDLKRSQLDDVLIIAEPDHRTLDEGYEQ